MHETRYVNEIIGLLKEKIAEDDRNKTIVVNIKLSPFSHVTPECLEQAFLVMIEDKGFGDVRLNITSSPFRLLCNKCEKSYTGSKLVMECPHCGSTDLKVEKGAEFRVDSLEIP
jgi:hydrogenase nickel insertion protein HypA